MPDGPLILWFRRDLRLADQPMLAAAVATGRALVPVFILDPETEALGAAAKWRLGLAVEEFSRGLQAVGSRLILRKGLALAVLRQLAAEVGASGVHWSRLYDPAAKARDAFVKSALRSDGLQAISHAGHLIAEPWEVATGDGGFYRVYTPFWNRVKQREVPAAASAPARLPQPRSWPKSDEIADWKLGAAMNRGAAICLPYQAVGESAARARLADFLEDRVNDYREARDFLARDATSRLSENLTYGEIGPRLIWHEAMRAVLAGARGAEHFLKELVWREFAYHLMHHSPHILTRNWRDGWEGFAWRGDNGDAEAWRRGMTGEPLVDAAMREMYVTGTMHNRGRMIAASYLTKHLLTDWRVGAAWFEDCLTDWDPASNAMGWQWAAGTGPDASPYFRVFNPATQAEKFDAERHYRQRFIAELSPDSGAEALAYFAAVPRSWLLDAKTAYPKPLIALDIGRRRALDAYAARNT